MQIIALIFMSHNFSLTERQISAMAKQVYEIDGSRFSTFEEFAAEITRELRFEESWHSSLDALNDMLRGGFGTPDEGFILIWRNSEISKEKLGYAETAKQLEDGLQHVHPSNVKYIKRRIEQLRDNVGYTLFDDIVEIISEHADIELRLQ